MIILKHQVKLCENLTLLYPAIEKLYNKEREKKGVMTC